MKNDIYVIQVKHLPAFGWAMLFLCPLLGRMVIGISACYITLVLNCYCTIINVRHNPSINSLYASVEISNRSLFSGGGEALMLALFGHHQKDSTFRCPVA